MRHFTIGLGVILLSVSLRKGWDRIADNYQRKMRIPSDNVYWGEFVPAESRLGLLGNVKGKRILEIGCGGAQNSIALAKWGAEAYAVDLSRTQILYGTRLARADNVEVNLIVCDMQKLPFREETFDIVLTAISLQYAPDLKLAIAEVNRVLLRKGHFTFSAMHPLYQGKLVRYRGKPAVVVRGYFRRRTIRWIERLQDGSEVRMHECYRTLQDYFDALTENGFVVDRYVELERLKRGSLHALDLEDIRERREARKLYAIMKEVPYWFVLKARKDV
jgi:ubiquinone/menaquinone biosynthesis C-methylase UbiE